MADKKFNFFESYHRALSCVPDSCYGRVVRGMALFAFEGIEPNFTNDIDNVAWELIRPILQHGMELSQVRAEVGKQGGERGKGVSRNVGNSYAKKENNNKSIANQKQNNSGKGKGIGKGVGIGNNNIEENKKENALPEYVSTDFADVLREWLSYKKERGEGYKQRGLKACYTRLLNLSANDPIKAREIVQQSIANNYSGLFKLKDNDYDNTNFRPNRRPTSAENIAAAQAAHIRAIADSISKATDRNGKVSSGFPFD